MALDRRLQSAIDDAFKDMIGTEFKVLITHLVEAQTPQPKGEPVRIMTSAESMVNFVNMVKLICSTYTKASAAIEQANIGIA
jgi:hypothetical protein